MRDAVRVTGIALAGGRSTRFGRDKLAEPYRGRPLLEHVVLALHEVCDEVVVVLAPDTDVPVMPVAVRVARDAVEGQGPLAGALAGLHEARGELAVLAGGDMPDLRVAVLREMLRAAAEGSAGAVVLLDAGSFRPLPCVLDIARARAEAERLLASGERSLRAFAGALRPASIGETTWRALDPEGRTLRDVDEPGQLEG